MSHTNRRAGLAVALLTGLGLVGVGVHAQELVPPPRPVRAFLGAPMPLDAPEPAPGDRPLPITLPTALKLANARALDIALASQRIQVSLAQLQQANVLWLPTLYIGPDYLRHDGQVQNVEGVNESVSKGSLMIGAGPVAVFALSDAFLAPLATRQVVQARQASRQATTNDTLLAVAEAYFNVQQARGQLAAAEDTVRRAEELVRRTEQLAKGLVPPVEVSRARAELADCQEDVETAREHWRLASAELMRLLRLDAAAVVQPVEPPDLRITVVPLDRPVDDLIPIALLNRPELAEQKALVGATLERLRQEKLRPLIPSIVLHGTSNPPETLGAGAFAGGPNGTLGAFGIRSDFDIEMLWELRNLGLGNRALVNQRKAEHREAVLALFRIQDRVAAEVAQAYAQVQSAAARMGRAESGLRDALDSVNKNFEGLSQTKRAGNLVLHVIRPQEAVAAVQALARAYDRYYTAVADYDRAQFRLYRALGQPAQALTSLGR
jgi:outer membrane protein TolC